MLRDLYEEGKIELDIVHLDASFVSAKKGGTKVEKGSQVLCIVENKKGLPVALRVEDANPHEINFAEKMVNDIRIPQKRGVPIKRTNILVADKEYQSKSFQKYLRKKGILFRIPIKKEARQETY
ncbi:transposase [Hazenella sp. IB182357]|uniref:Transposase n=1 Tax=Polycladospora coralii TaxID=2771432 RepID=A0A926N5L5_9BACL|nr:transposase [Polycladospora coralii]MBD1371899.1 transposase [Polycladospora coralii]